MLQDFKASLPVFLTKKEGFVTIGDVPASCSVATPQSTISIAAATGVTADDVAAALSAAINSELRDAGVALQIPPCTAKTAKAGRAVCNIQRVSIQKRRRAASNVDVTFTTYAGAGKNAGGLNAALARAVSAGM